ncbi:MAG: hypothetical protein ACP5NC_08370 [Nitrososphaeria archaeon]
MEYDIKELLHDAHRTVSYRAMARIFGVNATTVFRWATGKTRPDDKTIARITPVLEDMLNLSLNMPAADPANYGGPPENQFSWRKTDPPLLRKALNLMVRYAGILSITNREMMDTAALYIRETYREYKVGRSQLNMLALAALKVAALKHLKYINIHDMITDESVYQQFWYVISQHLYQE